MSTAKSLTDEQIETIRQWAEDGAELSDIQQRLAGDLEVKVTYLETRFLLEDLKIELKPVEVPEPEKVEEPEADVAETPDEETLPGSELPADDEEVMVTVDTVLRPGALISGQATFSSGKTAAWWLDQAGRLGMDPSDPDFRPSDEQMRSFQMALQRTIQESGM
ncbi:MAG: hypothetical protein P1U58_13830 [Verrucomicrobiales bacterium]|nr:hypothetical protein [Verrucomicrobiales bacterium]